MAGEYEERLTNPGWDTSEFYEIGRDADEEIALLHREIERSYQTLESYGVPRERAGSPANGIGVLMTRMQKEASLHTQEINSLKAKIKRDEKGEES